jgi:hypothetical protein
MNAPGGSLTMKSAGRQALVNHEKNGMCITWRFGARGRLPSVREQKAQVA